MPFIGRHQGAFVTPYDVDRSETVQCVRCEGDLGVQREHYKGESFIPRVFFHRREGVDCGGGGESLQHAKMKAYAAERARVIFPSGKVHIERGIADGDIIADVVVEFDPPSQRYGRGLAIEVQHKNESKDTKRTHAIYLNAEYSVYWAYESDFDLETGAFSFDTKRLHTVWPNAVPELTGFESALERVQSLMDEDQPHAEVEITVPKPYIRAHLLNMYSPYTLPDHQWKTRGTLWIDSGGDDTGWLTVYHSPERNREVYALEFGSKHGDTDTPTRVAGPIYQDGFRAFVDFLESLGQWETSTQQFPVIETTTTLGEIQIPTLGDGHWQLTIGGHEADDQPVFRCSVVGPKGSGRAVTHPYELGDGEELYRAITQL